MPLKSLLTMIRVLNKGEAMSKISWRRTKGKVIISKGDGVYFSLTEERLFEMSDVIKDIMSGHGELEQKDNRKPVAPHD